MVQLSHSLQAEACSFFCDRLEGAIRSLPVPETDDQLWDLVREAVGIEFPREAVCPHHVAPFTALADAYFARYPVIVVKASRGFGGKSFILAALACVEAMTYGAFVNLLGGSGEQSTRVLAYMSGADAPGQFWDAPNAPRWLIRGGFQRGLTSYSTRLLNGATVRALMASQTSVRGPHPQRLRLDEVDEMALEIFDAAMGQPMERGGVLSQTFISSTHHNAAGTMTEVLKRAGDKDWPVYEWCYRENHVNNGGWLTDRMIAEAKGRMTDQMWEVEVELQEPSPGSRAINVEKCEAAFQALKDLGTWAGDNGEYIEVEAPIKDLGPETFCRRCKHPWPRRDKTETVCWECGRKRRMKRRPVYATGTDWAKARDWTVIITFRLDVTPSRLVAFQRVGRMDWPAMIRLHEERVKAYGGASAHDETGIGDVIQDYLTCGSNGVWMVGKQRSDMLSSYITAIEHGEIVFPMIRWMYNEHKLASTEDVFSGGSKKHHLPDSMAAGAIAWLAAGLGRVGEIIDPNKPRDKDADQG